jgi:hypothetical protein
MLLDEARIASNIQHPNVAQIIDLGEANDVLFIVMERVDGDSLAKIRKLLSRLGASIPLGIGLRILADACAGLHAAHELRDEHGHPLGIVHRDVSPQNILVSVAGAVKVIDFGIAKAQNRQQGETRTGVFKGKVQYMAPEQVKKGAIVDRRADIWALGVCLHEIVTGKVPNDGDDHVEVIRRVLSDEPPAIAEGLPEPVARILGKSLNLDPDARFPTAAAMQDAFEEAMNELEVATTGSDIAAFLRSELPELEEKRRTIVLQSVDEARGRDHTPVSTTGDEAFAPTVMRERLAVARSAETVADKRPDDADEEPIRIPKQSRGWLWFLLLLTALGIGVRLARPAWITQALDRFAPAWALPWLAGQEPPGQSAGRLTEAPRAVLPPPALSLEPTDGASASARSASTPKPSTPRPAPRTPVAAASDTWIDAAATLASRPLVEGGLQSATPEAAHGTTTPPPAAATAPAPSAATSEAPPTEPAPSAVAPTTIDSPDAGESSPY